MTSKIAENLNIGHDFDNGPVICGTNKRKCSGIGGMMDFTEVEFQKILFLQCHNLMPCLTKDAIKVLNTTFSNILSPFSSVQIHV